MLGEQRVRNKENMCKFELSGKNETAYLMQSTIHGLKEEIQRLNQQNNMIRKQSIAEIDVLKLQLQQYKKKLSTLTDKYLLETFMKNKDTDEKQINSRNQEALRQKQILFSQQVEKNKKKQEQIKRLIDQNCRLKKQKSLLVYEKQRTMQISLTEKIQIEEKNKLLQDELKSKKNIIKNLKRQLEKVFSNKEDILKKQRAIEQKSKEIECFSSQVNQYNRLSQAKYKQKLHHLGKQNEFLKSYVKKLQKMAKKSCDSEEKDQKVKQNLFEVKRQLALAKVRLGETVLKSRKGQKRNKNDSGRDDTDEQHID